jgi:hypothetical protein
VKCFNDMLYLYPLINCPEELGISFILSHCASNPRYVCFRRLSETLVRPGSRTNPFQVNQAPPLGCLVYESVDPVRSLRLRIGFHPLSNSLGPAI